MWSCAYISGMAGVAAALVAGIAAVGAAQSVPEGARRPLSPAQERLVAIQVLLDRARFSPGEIDGRSGANTTRAIAAFEKANGVAIADAVRNAGEPPTVEYTIGAEDVAGPFAPAIPDDMMAKAELPRLDYTSALELLGERFHTAPDLLRRLNPSASFVANERIVVPNIIVAAATTPPAAPPASRVVVTVSKSQSVLTVADASGRAVYHAPATTGSEHDPLPIGEWTVTGIARNPKFHYNPELFWDADAGHAKATIQPGPNGPVGTVWIDLDKPHYGIHGTPEPGTVGHTASHGCVRLTNWDAAAVAGLVARGTKVVFVE
jgi:lipoprotein-anchoring transpeptidase ErfK/SrfK